MRNRFRDANQFLFLRSLALSLFAAFAIFLSNDAASAQSSAIAGKVHVLIVADTNAHGAHIFGLGIDGDKMKEMFDNAFAKTGKQNEYTVRLFNGSDVSPSRIQQYYRSLNTGPNDTLVFYYTGHGITDRNMGHVMTMSGGNMTRNQIMAEMSRHNPRLLVLLTDCCANYAGGGSNPWGLGQPIKGGIEGRRGSSLPVVPQPYQPIQPAPSFQPVPQFGEDTGRRGSANQFNPTPYQPVPSVPFTNPKPVTPNVNPIQPENNPVTDRRGSRSNVQPNAPYVPPADYNAPQIVSGDVALIHLLFNHRGVVDINASKVGESASGNAGMGGSYFTVALWKTLILPVSRIDSNKNGTAEWSEVFPMLDSATIQASQRGGFHQRPQAFKLAQAG